MHLKSNRMLRILIDTNILIHLEDHKVIEDHFSTLYKLAIENKCPVFYHEACLEDIKRDKNKERKQIINSKIQKYSPMPNPGEMPVEFSKRVGKKKENDRIDNIQLFQVYKDYVELFISEDNGIHKKAKKLRISEKVMTAQQASKYLEEKYTLTYPAHPILKHESIRKLEHHFDSTFFNSLKNDYDSVKFMEWIKRCAREDRKCYYLEIESQLSALLIYNTETVKDHKLKGITERAIKICTLKAGDDALGIKLGELFLNKMFQLCLAKKINYLYVTTYDKQRGLIHLLKKYGFELHDTFKNNIDETENVFLKSLKKEDQLNKTGTQMHPFFQDNQNKYVVPIQKQFYTSLFKDGNLREQTLFDAIDYGLQEVQGNTIIKAYVSKTQNLKPKKGDLLFFYSSGQYKTIEPIGEVIEHKRVNTIKELWSLVKNKTVYSQIYLEKMFEGRKFLTVTIFRFVDYLNSVIKYEEIKNLKSFKNKYQTFTKLPESDYKLIKNKYLNESRIIHKTSIRPANLRWH